MVVSPAWFPADLMFWFPAKLQLSRFCLTRLPGLGLDTELAQFSLLWRIACLVITSVQGAKVFSVFILKEKFLGLHRYHLSIQMPQLSEFTPRYRSA